MEGKVRVQHPLLLDGGNSRADEALHTTETVREAAGAPKKDLAQASAQCKREIIDLEDVPVEEIRAERGKAEVRNLGGTFIAPGATGRTGDSAKQAKQWLKDDSSTWADQTTELPEGASHNNKITHANPGVDVTRPGPGPAAKIVTTTTKLNNQAGDRHHGLGGKQDGRGTRDSYLARMSNVMTNERALRVLNKIEKKLSGKLASPLDKQ